MKYDLSTMSTKQINEAIDQQIMGNKPSKTCYGALTIYVEVRSATSGPMSWSCEECGGRWAYVVGQDSPMELKHGHWRVAPNYLSDMPRAMEALAKVAKSSRQLQEAVDFFLFQCVYNERGMPELKTGLSVVQRVVALTAEKIVSACIHALNRLDEVENAALAAMKGERRAI